MKNMKKTIAALSITAAMVATAGFGTLAYFTDTETATNEFTSGNLVIDLTETKWSQDANEIEEWNNMLLPIHPQGFVYGEVASKNIVPGRIIPKNPTVTVQKSEVASYVRMTVTMPTSMYQASNLSDKKNVKTVEFKGISDQWKLNSVIDAENSNITLVYDYANEVDSSKGNVTLPSLFEEVAISTQANNEDIKDLGQEFNVVINAYAVQQEGFEGKANEAFAAAFKEFQTPAVPEVPVED